MAEPALQPPLRPGRRKPPYQHGVAADQIYSLWEFSSLHSFPETLAEGTYLRTPAGFEVLAQGSLAVDPEATSRFLSPGGEHAIFDSNAHLEEASPPAGTLAVYDRAAGATKAAVVSVKPDGSPFAAGEDASYVAASQDGSAVLFRVAGTLYLRRAGQTLAVTESPNIYAGISEDGRYVFFGKAGALFRFDTQTESVTEIAPESTFVNVSPDGSGVIFNSKTVLTGGEENEAGEVATVTEPNLYAWDGGGGVTRFVAVLSADDFKAEAFGGLVNMSLADWTSSINPGATLGRAHSPTRSTPDGEVFAFQSHARLTAYDNEGVGEVYRYQPAAPEGQRLICPSCDPTGAPPSANALLQDISAASTTTETTLISNLTDDGAQLFFQSPDRLLPEDANDALDVYQWKAKGAGNCKRDGGCLALISSGQGEGNSFLYGMSADGHDVFFRTTEKLLGSDVPGSRSIYDARIEGGIPDPPPASPCQGDACQGAGSPPPVLPQAATTGAGEGNLPLGHKPRCPKGKRKVRAKGKVRCVRRHKHRRHRHRANHHGRAAK